MKDICGLLIFVSAFLPQELRLLDYDFFFHRDEMQVSKTEGWEWNGLQSPLKTDFEWFKNFKPVNSNDVLSSPYPKAYITWHQVLLFVEI